MFRSFFLSPKHPVLAGIRAEALVASSSVTKEPAATVGRGTTSRVNETGDFGGEALPECGAQRWRAIVEALAGNLEMERHAGQVVGDFAVQLFAGRS